MLKRCFRLAALPLALICGSSHLFADNAEIERGRYLVHRVAKCIECHSPRNSRGQLDRNRLLQGAPVPVKSPYRGTQWAFRAPAIAGLPGWSSEDVIHLLMTGSRRSGRTPLPPMPQYGMSREDAAAVTAYLESLH